jgi:hypothetical protein
MMTAVMFGKGCTDERAELTALAHELGTTRKGIEEQRARTLDVLARLAPRPPARSAPEGGE